jgi:hypothetical protein
MRDSTGIALRLAFGAGKRPDYGVIPLTFDDRSRVMFAAAPAPIAPGSDPDLELVDRLERADVGYESWDGARHSFGAWDPERRSAASAFEQWGFAKTATLTAWFPQTPQGTPLRPFDGAYVSRSVYVARRGAASLGEVHRALELEPGGERSVWARFRDVVLPRRLDVAFALPEDRLQSKFVSLRPQEVVVLVDDTVVVSETLPYEVGWRNVSMDTARWSSRRHDVTVLTRTQGTHFPVAVTVRLRSD